MATEDPIVALDVFSIEELQLMAVYSLLVKKGITDNPEAFMKTNAVQYTSTFRLGIGVAVAITKIAPIAPGKMPS